MRVIPPFPIVSTNPNNPASSYPAVWTCNIPENPTLWSSATTYAVNDIVRYNAGVPNIRSQYRSLQAGNLNHTPSSSPTWWKYIADEYVNWDSAITYSVGNIVSSELYHRVYQSLVNSNLNNDPLDTTKWMDIGPTNSTASIQLAQSVKTRANVPIIYTIEPNVGFNFNSIALFGLWATSVNIKIANSATPTTYFYDNTITLTPTNYDWLAYGPWKKGDAGPLYKENIVLWDLPTGTDVIITITITNTADTSDLLRTKVGSIILGEYVDIGGAEYGALNDSLNFSTISRSFDGTIDSIVKRRNIPRNNYTVYAPSTSIRKLLMLRKILTAEIAGWFGIDDYTLDQFDALSILGLYKRFTINVDQQDRVRIDLEIEEA